MASASAGSTSRIATASIAPVPRIAARTWARSRLHSPFTSKPATPCRRDPSNREPLPAYRLPSPYDRPPLQRRLSGFALAVAINLVLLLVLLTLGVVAKQQKEQSQTLSINLLPESRPASATEKQKTLTQHPRVEASRPVPKPPPIVLPSKPTITPPPKPSQKPWIEMSKDEFAAADISKLPAAGAGGAGDSEVIGRGPNGEALYAAEWAREPSDAEIGGYWPKNVSGWGLGECKNIPQNRVGDFIE